LTRFYSEDKFLLHHKTFVFSPRNFTTLHEEKLYEP
jgi:hypothetical protein